MPVVAESADPRRELRRAERRAFDLAVRRLATALVHGLDPSPYHGSGIEYAQSRCYQPGDPVRAMDWRVTARTARPHIKEYEALKRLPVWLLVDTSASMQLTSTGVAKIELALVLAGALGRSCQMRGSPVGLVSLGSRLVRAAPSTARERLLVALARLHDHALSETTALVERLDALPAMMRERSLVVVLSDLHEPGAVDALRRVHLRHDLVVLQLQDPAALGLGGGFVRGEEAETQRRALFSLRRPWLAGATAADPTHALRAAGIDHLLLRTDRPVVAPLIRFLTDRGGLLRRAR